MADKNYVKALRRAKSKKAILHQSIDFYSLRFCLTHFKCNFYCTKRSLVSNPHWFNVDGTCYPQVIAIQKAPKNSFFKRLFTYLTEKEMRLIEFEDDMDELEASRLEQKSLELPELERHFRNGEGELV